MISKVHRLLVLFLCSTVVLGDTSRVYRSSDVYDIIGGFVGNPRGILAFDGSYVLMDEKHALKALGNARRYLARRRVRYMDSVWDCEDYARYGMNEVKLYYRKHFGVNPMAGWITYQCEDTDTLHARTFVIVHTKDGIELKTYEMTRSVRYDAELEELTEGELMSVRWVIL